MRPTHFLPLLLLLPALGCGGSAAPDPSTARPGEVLVVGKTGGCGHVFTWRAGADNARFLTVRVAAKNAGLGTTGSRRYDLAAGSSEIVVQLEVFPHPMEEPPYCTDIIRDDAKPEVWKAEGGVVTITLTPSAPPDSRYRATVRARDLRFRGPDGSYLFVATATMEDVIVGWNPG
jgi:hypothetical protein